MSARRMQELFSIDNVNLSICLHGSRSQQTYAMIACLLLKILVEAQWVIFLGTQLVLVREGHIHLANLSQKVNDLGAGAGNLGKPENPQSQLVASLM